jgi:hypothetical protein
MYPYCQGGAGGAQYDRVMRSTVALGLGRIVHQSSF